MLKRFAPHLALVLSCTGAGLPRQVAAEEVFVLEEIIVTARRREESLQDTPVSLTVVSGELIEQTKMLSVTDLEQRTPALNVRASDNGVGSALQAFIRGVGQFDFALTVDPGVGTYVDGVYLSRTVGSNFQLADVEQIQVLRGPQGTLYGRNTIGGAINVVTRKPTGDTNFTAEVIGGEYDFVSFNGYAEFPISDKVSGSISALTRNSEGWQDRNRGDDAGNDDMWAVRGHLNADFSEAWNSHLVLDYTDIDQNVYPQVLSDFNPTATFPFFANAFVLGPQGESCCTSNINNIDNSDALNELDRDQNEIWGVSWTNTWDMEGMSLKSITGYRDMDSSSYRDADNDSYDHFSVGSAFDVQTFSQEFLLSSETEGAFDWLVGLYYMNEDGDHLSDVTVASGLYEALSALPDSVILNGVPARFLAVPLDLTLRYDRSQETTSYAAFFNTTWHMTDDARLNLAGRYTYDEKDLDMFTLKRASQTPILRPGVTDPGACSDVVADGNGSRVRCEDDWGEFTPTIGVEYDFSYDVMAYAHVSTGFRSGVFNGRPTSTEQISVADPETLLSYEVGLKSVSWDGRLQLNGAVFYNDYEDRQFLVNRPSESADSALALVVDNAADSTLWGAELEFVVLPFKGLTLSGGISYIDPEYENFDVVNPDTGELEDFTDRPFTNTPEWTANLLAQYEFSLNNGGRIQLRGDLAYTDEIFYTDDEACTCFDRLAADSYTIYNAGVTYVSPKDKWELSVFGRNLNDEREIRGGFGVDAFGTTTVSFTEPRRYFVSLRYRN
jgi:iron complex outermembrane receptor protein